MNRNQSALNKIQEEADKDAREESARNSWFGYMFSPKLSPQEVEARDRRATERKTGRIVREAELDRCMETLHRIQTRVDNLDVEIIKVKEKKAHIQQQEWSHQEASRLAEEARRRAQENERARQEREKARKEQEEILERMRAFQERRRKEEEARRAREEELQAEAEKQRAAERSELRRKEMERKAKEARKQKQDNERRKTQDRVRMQSGKGGHGERKASMRPGSTADATFCRHKSWWDHELGSHLCGRCQRMTSRFAFCCPGCQTVACAGCRDILKKGV